MSDILIRDGKFDLVIAAAPGVENWPSAGTRALTTLCADMGLSVAVYGGDDLRVRGVVPLPGTGGVVLVEDAQARLHRIQASSIVRVSPVSQYPDPFLGWRSEGLIPLSTAIRLRQESHVQWDPCTVILGSGNRALRFGSELIRSGAHHHTRVYCVETFVQWGAKRFSGWEVERRRFEMAGGKLIEAKPISLTQKSAMLWEVRLQDAQGVRLIEAARVVSAGPFKRPNPVREHPAGSLLFELEQSASNTPEEDIEGWTSELDHAQWLGVKIVRALSTPDGSRRDELERIYRKARARIKRHDRHQEEPFTPSYQGKWISAADSRKIRMFSGVPQSEHKVKPIASIECIEEIPCGVCQKVCPTQAISINPRPDLRTELRPELRPGLVTSLDKRILFEDRCTGCGLCLNACPSETISMIEEKDASHSKLTLSWHSSPLWKAGEFAVLLNRRGEALGSARVAAVTTSDQGQLVHLDVPSHLIWEARGIKRQRPEKTEDEVFFTAIQRSASSESKVEVILNGEKRLVRDGLSVATALFEMGQNRPEDALFCRDGSCGLCEVTIDGTKKKACDSFIHKGMALKLEPPAAYDLVSRPASETSGINDALCPCLGVTREHVIDRIHHGHLRSPEAVLSVTHVGEGRCHGRICMDPFLRILEEMGIETRGWVDWRFPWTEWTLGRN